MASKVSLHLYDLSQGMAKSMSQAFLGKQIDGIWHTGIVVFGKEFYYGGGICKDPPSKTPYGTPVKTIVLGETELNEEIFLEFLEEISSKFSADKYDLFNNNCNNFTDACCEFLIGEKIPSYITGLPKEVLNTPMGKMIKPMIDNMQKNMNQNSHPIFGGQQGGQTNQNGFGGLNNNYNQTQTNQQYSGSAVISVTAPDEFTRLIQKSAAVIVDFYSLSCGPCVMIKPHFERLAQSYRSRCPELKFVSVDVNASRFIAGNYSIQSIPTFIGFLEGSQFQRFSGADIKKIESLAFQLESKINSKNPTNYKDANEPKVYPFKLLNPSKKDFYSFSGTNYALPIKNIQEKLEANPQLNQSSAKDIFVKFSQNPQENVKAFSQEEKTALISWIFEAIFILELSDKTVGFLDLLRMLSLDASFLQVILKNDEKIIQFLKFLEKSEAELKELPKGLKLVLLRLITNLTASENSKTFFQNIVNQWVQVLTNAGKAYKDDKASLYPVLMSLWNLVQNFSKSKEFSDAIVTLTHFTRLIFNDSSDNEVILGTLLILSWLSLLSLEIRKEIDSKLDKAKLAKLEFSEDANLGKISRDLSDILEGKAF